MALLDRGCRLVQLRPPPGLFDDLPAVAQRAAGLCLERGATLVLNGPVSLVRRLDLPGVHLPSRVLMSLQERPVSVARLAGASCHSAGELDQAVHLGLDYALLSPVRETPSHPGAPVLGMTSFARFAGPCPLPVFALGGMSPGDLEAVLDAGGHGVAGISAFWD